MLSQNRKIINSVRILLLGAPLFLAACHSDFGPYPMPSGYTHHDQLYKAPPGPEPVLKHIEHGHIPQSTKPGCAPCGPSAQGSMPAEMIMAAPPGDAFTYAASDLIARLVADFGQPAEGVWLQPAGLSPLERDLENALRGAMMAKGFNVAAGPGMGPYTMTYAASPLGVGDGSRMMVTVTLSAAADGAVHEVSGIYALAASAMAVPAPMVMQEPAMHDPSLAVPPPGEPMPIGPLN